MSIRNARSAAPPTAPGPGQPAPSARGPGDPTAASQGTASRPGLTRMAVTATAHCLTGCAIGEVLGMVLGSALGLSNFVTVAVSIVLAFFFGYALTIRGVLTAGLTLSAALPLAFASDTVSIGVMEIVDNTIVVAVPGAMAAGLTSLLFWASLALSLAVAFVVTVPVNRFLISRGRGHAVMHDLHEH